MLFCFVWIFFFSVRSRTENVRNCVFIWMCYHSHRSIWFRINIHAKQTNVFLGFVLFFLVIFSWFIGIWFQNLIRFFFSRCTLKINLEIDFGEKMSKIKTARELKFGNEWINRFDSLYVNRWWMRAFMLVLDPFIRFQFFDRINNRNFISPHT